MSFSALFCLLSLFCIVCGTSSGGVRQQYFYHPPRLDRCPRRTKKEAAFSYPPPFFAWDLLSRCFRFFSFLVQHLPRLVWLYFRIVVSSIFPFDYFSFPVSFGGTVAMIAVWTVLSYGLRVYLHFLRSYPIGATSGDASTVDACMQHMPAASGKVPFMFIRVGFSY